jgi:hypothetical protein
MSRLDVSNSRFDKQEPAVYNDSCREIRPDKHFESDLKALTEQWAAPECALPWSERLVKVGSGKRQCPVLALNKVGSVILVTHIARC